MSFLTVPDYDLPSKLPANITGVATHKEYGATVRLATRLQPGLQHVFYIQSGLPANSSREAAIRNELAPFRNQLDVITLGDLTLDGLLNRVRSLPPHSAILFDTFLEDPSGKHYVPAEVSDLIAGAANAPVYTLYQTVMGKGASAVLLSALRVSGNKVPRSCAVSSPERPRRNIQSNIPATR